MINFKIELKINKNLLEELEKVAKKEKKELNKIIAEAITLGLLVKKCTIDSLKEGVWRII